MWHRGGEGESGGGGGFPRQTAFINSICLCRVNGCDCVTFAGSNPAPSFWLIMQGPIKIQGDACHHQQQKEPCNFLNLVPSRHLSRAQINRTAGGEDPKQLIETTMAFIKSVISFRNLESVMAAHILGWTQDLTNSGICFFLIDRFSGQTSPLSSGV